MDITGQRTKQKQYILGGTMILLASFLYIFDFFLRVSPGVIMHELMHDFHIEAAGFGLLASCFFFGYMPMQIPAGLISDRFGPRKALTSAMLACSMATLLFTFTVSPIFAGLTRIFVGIAAAFAYICPIMLADRWLPAKYVAMVAGSIQALGCMGAIIGGAPVNYAAHAMGWRPAMQYAAYIGFVFAALFWLALRDHPKKHDQMTATNKTTMSQRKRLSEVLNKRQTWWTAAIGFSFWAPMTIFVELWGSSYLSVAQATTTRLAAEELIWAWVGVALGGPLMGYMSKCLKQRRGPIIGGLLLSLFSSLLVIFIHPLSSIKASILLFIFGFGAAAQCVTFGVVSDNNRTQVMGTAIGFNNMAVVMGGVIMQPLVGLILGYLWSGQFYNHLPYYSIHNFEVALTLMPLCSLFGLWVAKTKLKESYGQKNSNSHLAKNP